MANNRVVQKGGWVYPQTSLSWVGPSGGFYQSHVDASSGSSGSYIVQEEDGTSKLILEEGTYFLLTEESS